MEKEYRGYNPLSLCLCAYMFVYNSVSIIIITFPTYTKLYIQAVWLAINGRTCRGYF